MFFWVLNWHHDCLPVGSRIVTETQDTDLHISCLPEVFDQIMTDWSTLMVGANIVIGSNWDVVTAIHDEDDG
jgi:hypothetical protein